MHNKQKYLALSIIFALTGCNEWSSNLNNDSDPDIVAPEVEPTRPENPGTLTPTVKLSYVIPQASITDSSNIVRDYTDAFTLDEVTFRHNALENNFTILNKTPRYINKPVLKVNQSIYQLDTLLEPFQSQTFTLAAFPKDEEVKSIIFVDEQPFFRSHMNEYVDAPNDPDYSLPTPENASQYEQELRSHKNVMNDFDFVRHFAQKINDYGTTRAKTSFIEEIDCPYDHDHSLRSGNDSSSPNAKMLSTLNHQPKAEHRMLHKSCCNGYATIGYDGFLSVRESQLYQPGQTLPRSTYLHEKMHNHGFNHDGGLTYGLPDWLRAYMNDWGNFPDYYDSRKLAELIPTATVLTDYEVGQNYVDVHFKFLTDLNSSESLSNTIDRFMIILPDDLNALSISVTEQGVSRKLGANQSLANGKVLVFDQGFTLPMTDLSDQEEESINYVTVRVPTPTAEHEFNLIATGGQLDWNVQANAKAALSPQTTGLKTADGQFVYYDYVSTFNEAGEMEKMLAQYTPEQANQRCIDEGFSGLGLLSPYKSQDQMDFQMAYLQYESQVGIDPETFTPVAVDVDTSYNTSAVWYSDTGALIVCK